MSTTLYWQLAQPARHCTLPTDIKLYMAKRIWGKDGSTSCPYVIISLKDYTNIAYLEGLRDAGVEGANDLLAAILQHDAIKLWIQ